MTPLDSRVGRTESGYMHAYRKLIAEQMVAGNMNQSELGRAAGLSRQRVNQLIKDDRPLLVQAPDTKTVEGLAKAFNLAPEVVWVAVAEAMGLPRFVVPSITHEVKDVDNAQLLIELGSRLNLEVSVRPASKERKTKKTDNDVATVEVLGTEELEVDPPIKPRRGPKSGS